MKTLYRILPLIVCIVLAASAAASYSMAFAVEVPATESSIEADTPGEESPEDPPASIGMFDSTASLGQSFMSGVWSLFGIYVPGFSFTFAQMWLGALLCSVSILVIRMIFGFGGSGGSGGVSSRTSSTNNPKISRERRNDEF